VDLVGKDLQSKKAPEAYLMPVPRAKRIGNRDSNLYEQGKKVLSKKAADQHEELTENLYISQAGYIEAFVVNETNEDVWFDDFSVMTTTPHVVQETHGACPESEAIREPLGTGAIRDRLSVRRNQGQ
jgi:hypothetical protein